MHDYFNRLLKPGYHTSASDMQFFEFDDVDADEADRILSEFMDTAIDFTRTKEEDNSELAELGANSPPVVRLLDLIIAEMRSRGSERVSISLDGKVASVGFEINGLMIERDRLPIRVFLALEERIRISNEATLGMDVELLESESGKRIEIRRARER